MSNRPEAQVRIAVVGAGTIGRRHLEQVIAHDGATLAAVVDPADGGRVLAAERGVAWYPSLTEMLLHQRPDGAIIATPNQTHVAAGLEIIAAGVPALIEKPLADDVAGATALVEAAERAGVALLTGHHRRHNPLVQHAKTAIEAGRLGRLVSVHGFCWFHKPHDYFDVAWRRQKGAGPVLLNLIHDVDLLRFLCGEVVEVLALEGNAVRGHEVEDSAVILLRFANGVLGTMTVSDTIAAPWSWELTSDENPAFRPTGEACTMIGGTLGSLAIPSLDLWRHEAEPSWVEPMQCERLPSERADPFALQVRNLCEVVRGTAKPVVSGRDGLETLRVIEAVKQAAACGTAVRLR